MEVHLKVPTDEKLREQTFSKSPSAVGCDTVDKNLCETGHGSETIEDTSAIDTKTGMGLILHEIDLDHTKLTMHVYNALHTHAHTHTHTHMHIYTRTCTQAHSRPKGPEFEHNLGKFYLYCRSVA